MTAWFRYGKKFGIPTVFYDVSGMVSSCYKRVCFPALVFFSCGSLLWGEEASIDFNRDIRPLLSNRCVACHGPDEEERKADLRLDTFEGATGDLGGYAALVPGDAEASELLYRITTDDRTEVMPPPSKGEPFTEEEAELIRKWIEQGGEYAAHWSYQKPSRPQLPESGAKEWSEHPVDRFIFRKLEEKGWKPSSRADRFSLARRIAIDLTGLPPAWSEVAALVKDESPEAIGRYVDQQLAKPAYAERWGRVWLDLARYADSAGYADDPSRTIWAFRDYVIRSMNENKPFDQFTIEQIAGDLLEDPTDDQIIATAFHRNTLTNNEGGTNNEEFRNVAVVDRVNTTMSVWMGTTMACAQCHTHKYDPLTHLEYFQLFDFFNQSADADRRDESPLFQVWSDEQKKEKAELLSSIERLKGEVAESTPEIVAARTLWTQKWQRPFRWQAAQPSETRLRSGNQITENEGWLSFQKADPKKEEPKMDQYELVLSSKTDQPSLFTGLRLEVGEKQTSNFVLSSVRAVWEPKTPGGSPKGRYVRVEIPGKMKTLHLAEIEIMSEGKNMATKGKATSSSVYASAIPERVNDGNRDGDYHKNSVFHAVHEDTPWIEIDLGSEIPIDSVVVWNRTDGGDTIQNRIAGYQVSVLNAIREAIHTEKPKQLPKPSHEVSLSGKREIPFSFAGASFEQKGFPAASVIAPKFDASKGWAIAGGTGKEQELLLAFSETVDLTDGILRVFLRQDSVHENHLLKQFRLSLTSENRLAEWAAIPVNVRLALSKGSRSAKEEELIAKHFQSIAPSLAGKRKELASSEKKLEAMKPVTTVPIMQDLPPEQQRESHIHLRGSYLSLGEKATAGVPEVFHDLPKDEPRNRLALAKWLVDEENPLTSRVVANRIWEQLFGIGLVETSEEFGSQGTLPSHPELLDWLAVELQESGWDRKAFLKLLVTSEAYLQDSKVDEKAMKEDPYNRYLARGPRFRVSAEMVRDQALSVAGLLSEKRYGPPVNPPQPNLGLKAAFGSKTDWETSKGEDRYRRGVYTTWRRSSPYPSMATFDAPNREVCTVRRSRTNTPLQALVTLNDPVFVEAAQAWGRLGKAREGSLEEQIRFQFRETLIREPQSHELNRLVQLYEEAHAHYLASSEEAKEMAENPIGAIPESAWRTEGSLEKDLEQRRNKAYADFAAWSVVGNVVLNLDEMFLKR